MYRRKQFIITSDGYVPEGFLSLKISEGYTLAYHKDLPLLTDEKKKIFVLGHVWQTDSNRMAPKDEVEKLGAELNGRMTQEDIINMEKSWCGEYVIIAESQIYTDSTAMRSVFYLNGAVAGCEQLLLAYFGKEIEGCIKDRIIMQGNDESFDFFPGPRIGIDEIRRLLPSQVLDFRNNKVHSRPLLSDDFCKLDFEQLVLRFIDMFTYSLVQMRRSIPGTIWLALTGGRDSRTTLALLSKAGIDFNCFTFDRALWTVFGEGDYYLPQIIAAKVGKRHLLLQKKKATYDENKRNDFLKATMLEVTGSAIDDYAYGQYDEITAYSKEEVVWIGSAIWEVYEGRYQNLLFKNGNEDLEEFLEHNKKRIISNKIRESLVEYFDWIDNNPQKGINNVDRFYWEQACAVWHAPYDRAKEMVEGVVAVQPLNCRMLLSALFALPEEMRCQRRFEEYLVARLCPQLKGLSYSGKSNDSMLYFPYYLFDIGDRVVIYGAGRLGKRFIRRIQDDGLLAISAVVDRNAENIKTCYGYSVVKPEAMKNMEFDLVLITVMNSSEARRVRDYLLDMGISEAKIRGILPLI